jgi:hypothetical protein
MLQCLVRPSPKETEEKNETDVKPQHRKMSFR